MTEEIFDRETLLSNFVMDFTIYPEFIPKELTDEFTQETLLNANFSKGKNSFEKKFSNVLYLTIKINSQKEKYYYWEMDENNFKFMVEEIEKINDYINRQVKEFGEKVIKEDYDDSKDNPLYLKYCKKIHDKKNAFEKKYHDFLNITKISSVNFPYIHKFTFIFDMCKNLYQLRLYFRFIEAYLDSCGHIIAKKSTKKRITYHDIQNAIIAYYAVLLSVKKIRKLYLNGISYEKLEKQFYMFGSKKLEKITLESNSKGWVYPASKFALQLASLLSKTTETNFKQILKKYKDYAKDVKSDLSKNKNIEKMFADRSFKTKKQLIPLGLLEATEEDFLNSYKWYLIKLPPNL